MPAASPPPANAADTSRDLVRWTRRYARSRTIGFLVQWVVIVLLVAGIGASAALTNLASRQGNTFLFYLSVGLMFLVILALAGFSVTRWGGAFIWRVTYRLYGKEGYVEYSGGRKSVPQKVLVLLAAGLVIYHLLIAILVSFNYLSLRHMLPASALYMAPFLSLMIYTQGLGAWAYVWPVLYALHAVLLAAGAPIAFHGQLQLLNMILPVLGYGLIAILLGHAYSRFALFKLKRLARAGLDPNAPDEEEPEEEEALRP